MKKTIFTLIVALCCTITACTKDRLITFAELPQSAQTTVQNYFDVNQVSYVTEDVELLGKEYEVRLTDGAKLEFKSDGSLKKIDCQYNPVPEALIPALVLEQVKAKFPQNFIIEWGEDDWGWKAELNNKLELKFNRNFDFVGIDD